MSYETPDAGSSLFPTEPRTTWVRRSKMMPGSLRFAESTVPSRSLRGSSPSVSATPSYAKVPPTPDPWFACTCARQRFKFES